MAKKFKGVPPSTEGRTAVVEFPHKALKYDAFGQLKELPQLIYAVEKFRDAFSELLESVSCASRPHSTEGAYVLPLWTQPATKPFEIGDPPKQANPFHSVCARLVTVSEKFLSNADSESPLTLKDLGVSPRELRALKELSRFGPLKVCPRVRTPDGRSSDLPIVDPELLGKAKPPDPMDLQVDVVVTGVAYDVEGAVWLQLEFSRRVKAPHLTLRKVAAMLPDQPRVVGKLKHIDGSYEFLGDQLTENQGCRKPRLVPV